MSIQEKTLMIQGMINSGEISVFDIMGKRIVCKGGLYLQKDGEGLQIVLLPD
jgi:hypothetical protein